jgi:hypothetical protein
MYQTSPTSTRRLPLAAALLLLGVATSGHAQDDGNNADAALVLGRVEVPAKRIGPMSARSVLSSVDVLDAEPDPATASPARLGTVHARPGRHADPVPPG